MIKITISETLHLGVSIWNPEEVGEIEGKVMIVMKNTKIILYKY